MARSVFLLVVVVATACVLLVRDVDAKKKADKEGKKMDKRRLPIILTDLENNVTALWKEVRQLGQPVHVHLHGDSHEMNPDHAHPHSSHEDHHHHSQENNPLVNDDDDDSDDVDEKKDPKKKHKHAHGDKSADDKNDNDAKSFKKSRDDDEEDDAMKKKMNKMKKQDHKHHHHHHQSGKDSGEKKEGEEGKEEEEEEGWKEKWMQGKRKGTHVHIHLHTGKEEKDDTGSKEDDHREPALPQEYRYARCDVMANSALSLRERQAIKGTIYFRHMPDQPLEAKGSLEGFVVKVADPKNPTQNHRGLHGHEFGDMSDGCNSLGGHLNPFSVTHGGPGFEAEHRHLGDFGNLEVKEDGTAVTSFSDDVASLFGSYSMLGRSIVVHAGPDDLGHGHSDSSKASGSAGGRIACCVIVACSEPADVWSSDTN